MQVGASTSPLRCPPVEPRPRAGDGGRQPACAWGVGRPVRLRARPFEPDPQEVTRAAPQGGPGGVFPEGEIQGARGARGGAEIGGNARSPGWNASRGTLEALHSGPPPPRRAALAPAVHPPRETKVTQERKNIHKFKEGQDLSSPRGTCGAPAGGGWRRTPAPACLWPRSPPSSVRAVSRPARPPARAPRPHPGPAPGVGAGSPLAGWREGCPACRAPATPAGVHEGTQG